MQNVTLVIGALVLWTGCAIVGFYVGTGLGKLIVYLMGL